jgi:hypothetical protein
VSTPAIKGVRVAAPDAVLRLLVPLADEPGAVGQQVRRPGRGPAAAGQFRDDLELRAEADLETAVPLGLRDAEEPGLYEGPDVLLGDAAVLLGLRRVPLQQRDEIGGARDEVRTQFTFRLGGTRAIENQSHVS